MEQWEYGCGFGVINSMLHLSDLVMHWNHREKIVLLLYWQIIKSLPGSEMNAALGNHVTRCSSEVVEALKQLKFNDVSIWVGSMWSCLVMCWEIVLSLLTLLTCTRESFFTYIQTVSIYSTIIIFFGWLAMTLLLLSKKEEEGKGIALHN